MKPGFLYVLIHPSRPNLFKIGVTILRPEDRLAQHNSNHAEYAGKIVKETGQKWELRTSIQVMDPYWAEAQFWGATGISELPYRGGIEVYEMEWNTVEAGLRAAASSGLRPKKEVPSWVHAYSAWMKKRLDGRGITLLSDVRSKFGKANFKCGNGHQWRTVPNPVAEGEGCPTCGMGTMNKDAVSQMVGAGSICLLVHRESPGLIRIEITQGEPSQLQPEITASGWEIHRFRRVEECHAAQNIVWKLLGRPVPEPGQAVALDLWEAEQAFRDLIPLLRQSVASTALAG